MVGSALRAMARREHWRRGRRGLAGAETGSRGLGMLSGQAFVARPGQMHAGTAWRILGPLSACIVTGCSPLGAWPKLVGSGAQDLSVLPARGRAAEAALPSPGHDVAPPGDAEPGRAGPGDGDRREPLQVVWPDGRQVSFSSGRYRLLDAADGATIRGHVEGPGGVRLEDTAVYFTDAADRFLVVRASENPAIAALVAPQTDVQGRFATPPVFPPGLVVTANALLAQNRRLVGIGVAGGADISVTLGSTYAIEFLRDAAGGADEFGRVIGSASVAATVAREGTRADARVAGGLLPPPSSGPDGDLVLGNGVRLAMRYAALAVAAVPDIALAWQAILPRPFHVVTTLAGNYRRRLVLDEGEAPATSRGMAEPIGITAGGVGDDAVYVCESGSQRIRRIASGSIQTLAGQGDPDAGEASVAPDGTSLAVARLGRPWDLEADAHGNLALTFQDLEGFHTVGFICRQSGVHFGRAMTAGTFYRLGAADGNAGYVDGPLTTARYRSPAGLTFDDAGNLYVADRRNNRIRRIDRATGEVSTVLGDGWPWIDEIQAATGDLPPSVLKAEQAGAPGTGSIAVPDLGRLVDRPAGTASGLRASFNRPVALAWYRQGDSQNLFILDSYNNAVRRARAPYPGDFRDAAVETVVGIPEIYHHADLGYSVMLGSRGPATEGDGRAVKVDFARYDPRDRALAQFISPGGMGIDAEYGRLYFVDTNNAAVRMLDLATGQVVTMAAHHPDRLEGDSLRVMLSFDLGGLAVLRDHSVVFTDAANQVVRRLVPAPGSTWSKR